LIDTEEKGLRSTGRPPKGGKVGAPPDQDLLDLTSLGISKEESAAWQKVARMATEEFEALLADLTVGPTIKRFSTYRPRRSNGGAEQATTEGTELLAVPRSLPSTLRELAKLHREIAKADTYKALRTIERKAEALKKLYADIDVVRVEAGKVIVWANHRIGEELAKLPETRGGNRKSKDQKHAKEAFDKPTLKAATGSKNRGLRLKKLGSQPKPVVQAAVEKLTDTGRDITVNAVLKTIAAKEPAKKQSRRASRDTDHNGEPALPDQVPSISPHLIHSAPAPSNLTCPFCNEPDFDKIGLKRHLLRGWCEEFEDTPTSAEPAS
jgi:hypothetical protein